MRRPTSHALEVCISIVERQRYLSAEPNGLGRSHIPPPRLKTKLTTHFENPINGATLLEALPVNSLEESVSVISFDHVDAPAALLKR